MYISAQDIMRKFSHIFVEGGNTFYLLENLKKTGMFDQIKKCVTKNLPYIGISAGTIICGTDIDFVQKWDEKRNEFDTSGFTFLPYLINTHVTKEDHKYDMTVELPSKTKGFIELKDGQAFKVDTTTNPQIFRVIK